MPPGLNRGIATDTYLQTPERTYDLHTYGLAGEHQTRNALLATRSAEFSFPGNNTGPICHPPWT